MSPNCPTDGTMVARVRSATRKLVARHLVLTAPSAGPNLVMTELTDTAMTAFRGCAEEVRE